MFEGKFKVGDTTVPRCTMQEEHDVRFLAINIPADELGALARGKNNTPWSNGQLGRGILVDIIESGKERSLGAFKIFADEQSFTLAVVSIGQGRHYREFGKVRESSFLRLSLPLVLHSGPYRESANEHLMDRLAKMFELVQTEGLKIGSLWARKAAEFEAPNLSEVTFANHAPFPPFIARAFLEDTLRERLAIDIGNIQFPRELAPCEDRATSLWLRIPIKASLISHLLMCEEGTPAGALGALDDLRFSVERELDQTELSENVRVLLTPFASRMSDEVGQAETSSHQGPTEFLEHQRYALTFELYFDGDRGSQELQNRRQITLTTLFQALEPFKDYLGK